MAGVDSKASDIAALFIAEQGIDQKYLKVLTQLIEDQVNKFKSENKDTQSPLI